MATRCSSSSPRKEKASPLPKRGQIKAQIFSSFVKFVASKFSSSKVGKDTGKGEKNVINGGGISAASTPPPTSYNSDVS